MKSTHISSLIGVTIGVAIFFCYHYYQSLGRTRIIEFKPTVNNNNINLGQYDIRAPKHAIFEVVNNGDQDIIIDKVIPDCDCYSVTVNKDRLSPNDTLIVDTKYDAYPGPFLKKIHLHFKGHATPIVLFFKGKVLREGL
ncbi:DUF1573 domain-containing protein [Mucilaginibacter daejeonensis]|uniref:DUF1573 domain-containing protein n=1 Tax=Mucilaginibacter daejeonensis TaxID=398049 RepID=UPI001D17653E|nr:DUF1573 domain-containing protein [Mucilaginibacter daejeonensis]UEG54019.1 DUF1573 domain-containing protein [Mucilaginibacter daejeonensis]